MALINCKACGGMVSEEAISCPHCGHPIGKNISAPPIPPRPIAEAGVKVQEWRCPTCGNPITRANMRTAGWAYCEYCRKDIPLAGVSEDYKDNGIVEKMYPTESSAEDFHRRCMQKLMDEGKQDIFDELRNVQIKQKYFWVREFGVAEEREIFPACQYGKDFFKAGNNGSVIVSSEVYESLFPTVKMRDLQMEWLGDAELITREYDVKEIRYEYLKMGKKMVNTSYSTLYYLPAYEESFDYKGKTYTFRSLGNKDLSFFHGDELPKDDILGGSPKYTSMTPVFTLCGIVLWLAFLLVVAATGFRDGFSWQGIGILVIGGIVYFYVLMFLTLLLGWIPLSIDLMIRKSINGVRRGKFRSKYKKIQQYKQEQARRLHGLELTYTIPDFPIP